MNVELGGDWPAFCRALSCSPSSHRSQSDPTPPNPITSSPCCNAQTPKQHPQGAAQTPDLDPRGPGSPGSGHPGPREPPCPADFVAMVNDHVLLSPAWTLFFSLLAILCSRQFLTHVRED